MKALLEKFHAKLGDLWWYSLMIFVACRSGDVIQAFIGLWLVPQYVGPEELGAVLPLQQLSGLFAVPLAILATVFAKYVNTYATRGEYGKVKSFIHDVLLTAYAVFLVCIAIAYLVIPHFYERLNVQSGLLTVLILAAGFAGNISNLFTSALQGLKKFKTMTIQNLIGAPVRLATLLITMPIRALSGYILGQTTPPATCSLFAAWTLHRDLKNIPTDTSWRKDLPEIWRYLWPVAIYTTLVAVFSSVTTTIYRQRLPEVESATYYLLTRFAEIAGYVGCTIVVVLFPLISEAKEKGVDGRRILWKALAPTLLSAIAFATVFAIFHHRILSCSTTWVPYVSFSYLLPILTVNSGLQAAIFALITHELASRRFISISFYLISAALMTILFVTLTGYTFFAPYLPTEWIKWMGSLNIARLDTLTYITTGVLLVQIIGLTLFILHDKKQQ